MYVILVYDIKSDQSGSKVLSKTFKICKKYLTHIQNSVFEGEISESQLLKLKMELNQVIREDRDSLIVFKCRNEKWIPKEFWGVENDKTSNFLWLSTWDSEKTGEIDKSWNCRGCLWFEGWKEINIGNWLHKKGGRQFAE
mgnify:CR=1 FL=1